MACLFVLLFGLMAACSPSGAGRGATAVPLATPQFDAATGLELNPITLPDGEFVVMGTITAVTLIPQDAPLIKLRAANGQIYQLLAQPVPQITYDDGTAVPPLDIKNGVQVRATVQQSETGGLGGEPVLISTNFTVLLPENE